MNNHDESILRSRRIDRRAPYPVLHQALRIALYNAYAARSFHARVVDAFGTRPPFTEMVKAEERTVAALSTLCQRFGIPRPLDAFPMHTQPSASWLTNCQRGLSGEMANIRLYTELLTQVREPEAQKLFTRLQSDARERHLPVFRHAVLDASTRERYHATRGLGPEQADVRHGALMNFFENALIQLAAHTGPTGVVAPLLRHTHPASLAGAALGGASVYFLRNKLRQQHKEN